MIANLDTEVWLATALLHRENPTRNDFTLPEIRAKVVELNPKRASQPGLGTYLSSHCVAGKKRQDRSINARILTDTGRARRRLFRAGDHYDASRKEGKVRPTAQEVPPQYRGLIDWYDKVYNLRPTPTPGQKDRMVRLRELIGTISRDDLALMSRVIEEGCERVDEERW